MYEIFSVPVAALTREPASFWRENVVAVVILLRVLAKKSKMKLFGVSYFLELAQKL